jgi:hypothetical protein
MVKWGDAFIKTHDFKEEDAINTEPCWRYTTGFFIAENKHGVVLSTDEYQEKDDGVAAEMFIPWGMIEEWWEYT